jgi:TolB protein
MDRFWTCAALVMLLGCGSDGTDPGEEPVLRNRLIFQEAGGIGVMAPDGSQRQIIPIGSDLQDAFFAAVSPDGRRVAFTGIKNHQYDLYVMNVDGSARTQLTDDEPQDLAPAWSPDGQRLLFTHELGVSMIRQDGSGRQDLGVVGSGGTWSPDGRRVAFYGLQPFGAGIYVMDENGGNMARVDRGCGPDCTDAPTRWSPDGQWMGFGRVANGREFGGIMRADGSEVRLLLPPLEAGGPIWSPDGEQVALTRIVDGGALYVLTLATNDTVRLADAPVTDWTR